MSIRSAVVHGEGYRDDQGATSAAHERGSLAPRRRQLSDFLRHCRGRVPPTAVGLPNTQRRRTPGLRREDVAALAGVSVTWYTWLEQGRDIHVSDAVLERIAQTLKLSGDEREYLFALVQQRAAPLSSGRADEVGDGLERMIEALGVPALVMTTRWDIVAWNGLAAAIFGMPIRSAEPRNFLRMLLVEDDDSLRDPAAFEIMARRVLARFRIDYGRAAGAADFDTLVAELAARCPVFQAIWSEPAVGASAAVVVDHPQLGGLALEHSAYVPAGSPTLRVMVLVPSDAPSAAKIAALRDGLAPQRPRADVPPRRLEPAAERV